MNLSPLSALRQEIKPSKLLRYNRDGHLTYVSTLPAKIDVFPGSWNPLHAGHQALFDSIENPHKFYELSLARSGKEELTNEEVLRRLEQPFHGPVLITNALQFKDKLDALKVLHPDIDVTFHFGFDTAERVLQDHVKSEIESYDCKFMIYERNGKGINDIPLQNTPKNFLPGTKIPSPDADLSSTAIREAKWEGPKVFPTVDIAIIDFPNRRILLGGKDKDQPDKWRFPGGFVDVTDKNFQTAAHRELGEEVKGLSTIGVHQLNHIGSCVVEDPRYDKKDKIMTTIFLVRVDGLNTRNLKAGDDLSRLGWFDLDDFISHLLPHHVRVANVLLERLRGGIY